MTEKETKPPKGVVSQETLDEIQKREVLAIVSVGGTRRTAAKYVRCRTATIQAEAEADLEFGERLRNAESRLELLQLKNIEQAANSNWRASAWLLERVYPERYGARKPKTLTVEQAEELWQRMSEVVLQEVGSNSARNRLAKRLKKIADQLLPARG